jgi:DNA polymerase-3 subunit beta
MTSNIIVDTSMRIRCARDELAAQLGTVGRGLSTRPSVQIFSSVLMQAASGRLELAATDMEISVRSGLTADVEGDGSAAVPGRLLADIVKLLPEDEVDLAYHAEESSLHVTSGSASYRLGTYAVEDFPKLPEVESVELTTIAALPFLETVRCVGRAAGRDESRPVLTGVLVRMAEGRLVMAATDSYRLSVKETPLENGGELEAIVPARALEELRRIATAEGEIAAGMLDNHVVFHAADTWLTSRRIDGQFPDYTKLIPDASEFVVDLSLPRTELLDVVRRVGVMAHRASPLRLRLADGELTISAQTQDVGEARESMPTAYSGEPLEVGFNADYLRDGIESVEGDEVAVKLINPLRPGLLQGDGDSFRYLIMPIRLAG